MSLVISISYDASWVIQPNTLIILYIIALHSSKKFIADFTSKFNRYPSTSGASAYTILYEYKSAVERAGTFETAKVTKALEGHAYQLLKDQQVWRAFDHQSIQTVYMVQCKPASVVIDDPYRLDYFKIIHSLSAKAVARTYDEWCKARLEVSKPEHLEKLPESK